jgi:hypothetical protein
LEVEKPPYPEKSGFEGGGVWGAEGKQRKQGSGCVVGIWDAAGEVGPRPTSGSGVGVGMNATALLP